MSNEQNKLIAFEDKEIRRIWHEEEWWFSVIDVVGVLTESKNPSSYWRTLKTRLKKEGSQVATKCSKLKLASSDGKKYKTDCANVEIIFRLIQSIPSPNVEPFKQWLAKVGYERVQEIENPELAAQRARDNYKALGYDAEWIDKRLQSINVRSQLTDEWKNRDVKEGIEYSILTAEIFRAAFGVAPSEHKEIKGLKRENLRDHMTDLELIFTMLAETTTKNKAIEKDAKGFHENRKAAIEGGAATGKALETYEKETGAQVVSSDNYKAQIAAAKEQRKLERKNKRKNKDE